MGAKGHLTTSHRVIQCTQGEGPVKAAIVILDPTLGITVNQTHQTKNIAMAVLRCGSSEIGVMSLYLEGDRPLEPYLTKIRHIVHESGQAGIIAGGDFNASSHWWGCDTEDRRGADIVDLCSECSLNILNRGSSPTFYTHRGGRLFSSIVDVTVCSDHWLGKIENWRVVTEDTGLSDHRRIKFVLKSGGERSQFEVTSTRVYDTTKANWKEFSASLKTQMGSKQLTVDALEGAGTGGSTQQKLEDATQRLTQAIQDACINTIPPRRRNTKPKQTTWWTEKLTEMKQNVKTLRRRIAGANEARKAAVYAEYAEARDEYKTEIENSITGSWKRFCSQQKRENLWKTSYREVSVAGE